MTIMESTPSNAEKQETEHPKKENNAQHDQHRPEETKDVVTEPEAEKNTEDNPFSEKELPKETTGEADVSLGGLRKTVTITTLDKVTFIDSVVNNTRFMRDYALFGGKINLTLRSLTTDEVNALSAYIIKQGSSDTTGLLAGKYRKYLVAAQVETFNGTKMPPLDEPLFETLAEDGKSTVPPGWIKRSSYWDGMAVGLFDAIMSCVEDFDARYSLLCKKAEDANFWNPDTP